MSDSGWGAPQSPLSSGLSLLFFSKACPEDKPFPKLGAALSMGQVAAGVSLELSFHHQQISSIFPCEGALVLRSKASPVTSPTSKAPGTSHQAQRSFLKKADEATPATRSYLHPALCTPTSPPCLFFADLRQANTFYWNKTNAIKNLLPQKEQTKLQEKFCTIPLNSKFYRGSGDLQASLLPQVEVVSPPGSLAGSWECSVFVPSCQSNGVQW